jgi:putative salt-induced outer membrane protein YdiY
MEEGMRNFSKILLTVALVCIPMIRAVMADEVNLKNGDRLSGKIITMGDGNLVLETSFADKITIKWAEVASIKTDSALNLVLADGTAFQGIPQLSEAETMILKLDSVAEPVVFDMSQIKSINPPEEPPVRLTGQVNVGFNKSTGNTKTEKIHVDGEIVARTKKNRYTAGGQYNRSEDDNDKTEDNALGYLKYDHFLSEKLYFYLNGLFEKDKFKDINLRTTVGPGLGYQVFESDLMNLSFEAGPSYVNTDYDVQDDDDNISGRWAMKFDRFFFEKLFQYYLNNEGYVSLSDTQDVFMFTRTGLRFPVRAGIFLNAGLEWDWDNTPSLGNDRSDYRYILSLGYGF